MKTKFSNTWKRSVQPRKQVKFRENAPLHTKRKMLSVRLSKQLTEKHKTRNIPVRKGDKVKIVRGQYAGSVGTVDVVDVKRERILITGTERIKRDGTKSMYPIHPSNLIIQEMSLDDKKRKMIIERRQK